MLYLLFFIYHSQKYNDDLCQHSHRYSHNLSLSLDKFYDDDFVFVTEEKADELNCYAEEGDLIFTAAGTIGQVGILEAPLKYKKYVISNKQLRARIDTRKVDLLYPFRI